MRSKIISLIALLCITFSVVGCEPSEYEIRQQAKVDAQAQEKAQKQRWDDLDDDLVWVGTVTGYRSGWSEEKVVMDLGGQYDAEITLAHISTVSDDYSDERDLMLEESETTLKRLVPVGARVGALRSRDEDGQPDTDDEAMLYLITSAEREPDSSKASVNEELTRKGAAVPDPLINLWDKDSPDYNDGAVKEARTDLSPFDFKNWKRVAKAYREAVAAEQGPVGKCVVRERKEEREEEKERREAARETRRWELGPDGRRNTQDDYTYGDGRDGDPQGGGGFDIPDWACPTRWC